MDDSLTARIQAVKIVVMDVDGVLTDGTSFRAGGKTEGLFFSVQDGTGLKWLHRAGIQTALITGRELQCVLDFAQEVGIKRVVLNCKIKIEAYRCLKEEAGLSDAEVCYMGDDLLDLPILRRAGLAVAVLNARPEVKEIAHMTTQASGGEGAVREVAELILKTQGKWQHVVSRYYM